MRDILHSSRQLNRVRNHCQHPSRQPNQMKHQGDMGHATPEMLTKVYAAIVDEDRMHNAEVIEASVLSKIHLKS